MEMTVNRSMSEEMSERHQGAIDLSAMAGSPPQAGSSVPPSQVGQTEYYGYPDSAPAAGGPATSPAAAAQLTPPAQAVPAIRAPLITDVDERSFDHTMAVSRAVPVVLVLYSPKSLASKNALKVVEDVARKRGGQFQVGKVDVEASPTLASAFQAQAVPAGYALLAGRPLPLFEGVPTEAQMNQLADDLLQIAAQAGVSSRLELSSEDLEQPTPPEHLPAREAEEEGDWDAAIAAWKKVLANNPGDKEAKLALARCQFQARQEADEAAGVVNGDDAAALGAQADALFSRGDEAGAFALLLQGMAEAHNAEEREILRLRLVELFKIASDSTAVKSARRKLATMLMV